MRVFIASAYDQPGQDAMVYNPGNLYFYYGISDILPLGCPYTREELVCSAADYIVNGPHGWCLVRDGLSLKVLDGPRITKSWQGVQQALEVTK